MSMFHELMMRKKEQIMYATIKGSLTNNDGVISGFSSSNYLEIQGLYDFSQPFEIKLKMRTMNNPNASGFLRIYNDNYGSYSALVGASNNIGVWSKNTNDSYIANGAYIPDNTIVKYTFYYIKFIWTGTEYLIYLSTDNVNFTKYVTATSSDNIGTNKIIKIGATSGTQYFPGEIDLNRSYIKIGSTKYKLQAVVGYTVVGSPTISDGVVSGFSADNWLHITSSIPDNRIEDYNFYTKFTISSTSRQSIIGYYGSSHNFGIMTENKKILFVIGRTSSNNEPTITSSVTYNIGDTVYVNAYYLGNNVFVLKTSLDGINWNIDTLEIDITTINNIQANYPFRIGRAVLNNYAWVCEGSIYVNETDIKINNKLWFNGQQS